MNDARTNFDAAVATFRGFLRSQGWSEDLIWLTRDRITGHRCQYWLLRPDELDASLSSRRFYESVLHGSCSIRIDALAQLNGKTLCYVENYGGDSKSLNFGIWQCHRNVKVIQSSFCWSLLSFANKIRGESPFLKQVQMTETAESSATPNHRSHSAPVADGRLR